MLHVFPIMRVHIFLDNFICQRYLVLISSVCEKPLLCRFFHFGIKIKKIFPQQINYENKFLCKFST